MGKREREQAVEGNEDRLNDVVDGRVNTRFHGDEIEEKSRGSHQEAWNSFRMLV